MNSQKNKDTILPQKYTAGDGFILGFDNDEKCLSRQQDILICDTSTYFPLFREGDFIVVPSEVCKASIEVKSKLTSPNLRDALKNQDSVSQFYKFESRHNTGELSPFKAIFFYEGWKRKSPNRVLKIIQKYYLDTTEPMEIEERLAFTRNRQDQSIWSYPWLNIIGVLGLGVFFLTRYSVNGVLRPTYIYYQTFDDKSDWTYGVFERMLIAYLLGRSLSDDLNDRFPIISKMLGSEYDPEHRDRIAFIPSIRSEDIESIGKYSGYELDALKSIVVSL